MPSIRLRFDSNSNSPRKLFLIEHHRICCGLLLLLLLLLSSFYTLSPSSPHPALYYCAKQRKMLGHNKNNDHAGPTNSTESTKKGRDYKYTDRKRMQNATFELLKNCFDSIILRKLHITSTVHRSRHNLDKILSKEWFNDHSENSRTGKRPLATAVAPRASAHDTAFGCCNGRILAQRGSQSHRQIYRMKGALHFQWCKTVRNHVKQAGVGRNAMDK